MTANLALQSKNWATAPGEVLSSKTVDLSKTRKPEITYTYMVDGRQYNGDRILMGPGPMGGGIGLAKPREYMARYPVGRQIRVYYNPADPAQCVLEPGVNRIIILIGLARLFFLCLGALTRRQFRVGEARCSHLAYSVPTDGKPVHAQSKSVNRLGRVFDNIMIERLWRSVKYEEVYLKDYRTVSDAIQGIGSYFELYNLDRRHQSLGRQLPWEVYQAGLN